MCALGLKTRCTFGPISTYKEPVCHEFYKHDDKFSKFQTGMHLSKRSSVFFFFFFLAMPCSVQIFISQPGTEGLGVQSLNH